MGKASEFLEAVLNFEVLWTNLKFSFGENSNLVVIFGLKNNYLTIFISFVTPNKKARWYRSTQRKFKIYASKGSK